jgi:putative hydrolase
VLDLRADFHVHTAFDQGRDSVGAAVTAAERAGLRRLAFADRACGTTAWLPAYQSAIRRARSRTDVELSIGVEVEAVRVDGWLDMPADLTGLEAFSVAVSRLPVPDGTADARQVRADLAAGVLRPDEVAGRVVATSAAGVERASRYAPSRLARPLHLLTQVGIDPDELDEDLLAVLAAACRATGTAVEVSEAWRAPTARLAYRLVAAGVQLVPASDANSVTQLGQWEYLRSLRPVLIRPAGPAFETPGPAFETADHG